MTKAIGYIDFNKDILLEESLVIHQVLNGFYKKEDLENMSFDDYEKVVDKVRQIRSENAG